MIMPAKYATNHAPVTDAVKVVAPGDRKRAVATVARRPRAEGASCRENGGTVGE